MFLSTARCMWFISPVARTLFKILTAGPIILATTPGPIGLLVNYHNGARNYNLLVSCHCQHSALPSVEHSPVHSNEAGLPPRARSRSGPKHGHPGLLGLVTILTNQRARYRYTNCSPMFSWLCKMTTTTLLNIFYNDLNSLKLDQFPCGTGSWVRDNPIF